MDSFTTISNTSNIPTNSDDGGSGNNAYCVIAWPHPTHYDVRSAVISFYFNALTLFLDPHTHHIHGRMTRPGLLHAFGGSFFVLLQRLRRGIYLWRGFFVLFLYYYFGDSCGEVRVWTSFGRIRCNLLLEYFGLFKLNDLPTFSAIPTVASGFSRLFRPSTRAF